MKWELFKVGKNENAEITVRDAVVVSALYFVGPHSPQELT